MYPFPNWESLSMNRMRQAPCQQAGWEQAPPLLLKPTACRKFCPKEYAIASLRYSNKMKDEYTSNSAARATAFNIDGYKSINGRICLAIRSQNSNAFPNEVGLRLTKLTDVLISIWRLGYILIVQLQSCDISLTQMIEPVLYLLNASNSLAINAELELVAANAKRALLRYKIGSEYPTGDQQNDSEKRNKFVSSHESK